MGVREGEDGMEGRERVLDGGVSELLLRKVQGIFILCCFSLIACLPASPALHSFSQAFHAALLSTQAFLLSLHQSSRALFFRQGHLETSVNMLTKLFRQTDRCSEWRRARSLLQASFSFIPLLLSLPCLRLSIHD